MTPGSRDIIILVTWSKLYISEMWRQQNYKLIGLQTIYFLKSTIKYLPNDGSIGLIAHVVQNLWTYLFFKKIMQIMTSFH